MQQNRKYALMLEAGGFYKEASEIYKDLLLTNPSDEELLFLIEAINKKIFKKFDPKKKNFFIKMKSKKDFLKFEKWLVKL